MSVEIDIKTKICTKCGKEKPLSKFHKNDAASDGVRAECKDCTRIAEQIRCRSKSTRIRPPNIGLYTFKQIQSAVREMARLQAIISVETERRDSLISRIFSESAEQTEPLVLHQINMKSLIRQYFQEHYGKTGVTIARHCEYGIIHYSKNKVEVELYVDKAMENRGKPRGNIL